MNVGDFHLIKTVGAPNEGDPRDGEIHRFYGRLPDHFDLEPWTEDGQGEDAHYVKDEGPPDIDKDGNEVWQYLYRPSGVTTDPRGRG